MQSQSMMAFLCPVCGVIAGSLKSFLAQTLTASKSYYTRKMSSCYIYTSQAELIEEKHANLKTEA
jgi:hypothetical protein